MPGDVNFDGIVDDTDFQVLVSNFGAGADGRAVYWNDGDFNGSGRVDIRDVLMVNQHRMASETSAAAAVPEPSSACLAALALVLLGLAGRFIAHLLHIAMIGRDEYVYPGHSFGTADALSRQEKHTGGFGGDDAIVLRHVVAPGNASRVKSVIVEDGATLTYLTDYEFGDSEDERTRILYRLGDQGWSREHRGVEVQYVSGYIEQNITGLNFPEDIRRACEDETARLYKAANTSSGDGGFIAITQRTPDSGSVLTYTTDDLSPIVKRTLDAYRHQRYTA